MLCKSTNVLQGAPEIPAIIRAGLERNHYKLILIISLDQFGSEGFFFADT